MTRRQNTICICVVNCMLLLVAGWAPAEDIPRVFHVENSWSEFPPPLLPNLDALPEVRTLPDPFEWSDHSGRCRSVADWAGRRAEIQAEVETLGRTSHAWFLEEMFAFRNAVKKLPYDHHELMATVAPRALFVLGNPDYEWLADESGYVSCRPAHEVWKAFGIGDRFGYSIEGGRQHCRLPASQRVEVEAFVDTFLFDKTNVDTAITRHPFPDTDAQNWFATWATEPTQP